MSEPVTFIKKRKGAPSGLRKKPEAASPVSGSTSGHAGGDASPTESEVVMATKRVTTSHLIQGTGNKKSNTVNNTQGLELSDDEGDDQGGDHGTGTGSGRSKRQSYAVRHSATTQRPRRRSSSPPAEISSESIKAAAAAANGNKAAGAGAGAVKDDDGLYRGQAGQQHQLKKAFGPVKAGPSNVRTITLVDYQPDVCKDYKETGFCGFGDTCKFLHDRGDYLHGWQLDNSFLSNQAASGSFMAKQQARDGEAADGGDGNDSDTEELPFACLICRKPFGPNPVVTLCGHYFDAACAVKRFAKTGKCFACGAATNGVFNRATKLIEKTKERERLNAEAAAQEREFEDDDDTGVEIEGLEESRPAQEGRTGEGDADEEEVQYEDEEEEERPRKKRRPIIEIQ